MRNFTTITDLRGYLSDTLFGGGWWHSCPDDLNGAIEHAIRANHDTFSNYGDISGREIAALSRAVWGAVMGGGADYPFAQDDAERILGEDETDTNEQADFNGRA